jgi:hypothetical protein
LLSRDIKEKLTGLQVPDAEICRLASCFVHKKNQIQELWNSKISSEVEFPNIFWMQENTHFLAFPEESLTRSGGSTNPLRPVLHGSDSRLGSIRVLFVIFIKFV